MITPFSYKNHLHKGKDVYHHVKFFMNSVPNSDPQPQFYTTTVVSAEETMRILEEQRRPRTSTEEVVFSCHGQCMRCFFPGCGIRDTPK